MSSTSELMPSRRPSRIAQRCAFIVPTNENLQRCIARQFSARWSFAQAAVPAGRGGGFVLALPPDLFSDIGDGSIA